MVELVVAADFAAGQLMDHYFVVIMTQRNLL
jgi:hypothetical protein